MNSDPSKKEKPDHERIQTKCAKQGTGENEEEVKNKGFQNQRGFFLCVWSPGL